MWDRRPYQKRNADTDVKLNPRHSDGPMSREQILRLWPERSVRPRQSTLWTWLDRLTRDAEILMSGQGTKRNPNRYYLPNMEMKWQDRAMERLNKMLGLGQGKA